VDSSGSDILSRLTAQQEEVDGFVLVPVQTVKDVENLPLAFPSARKALLQLITAATI
jgi:ABC-type molybdate transport system substrate-binding protein